MTPKDFIKNWFSQIDGNKYEALGRLMDASHTFANPMTPAPVGKDQHLDMIKMMTTSFGETTHTLDKVVSEGEWVTARGRVNCRHTGDFNGIAPTNRQIEFSWIDMMHVVDGKVKEEYFELNPAAIIQQIS